VDFPRDRKRQPNWRIVIDFTDDIPFYEGIQELDVGMNIHKIIRSPTRKPQDSSQ
jgi:hypothetical protein